MKKFYFALAAIAAFMAFSCDKEQQEAPVSTERNIQRITCSFDSPDTKMVIPDNGKAQWEIGDEIYIHGKYFAESITHALTEEEISADGKKATFDVDFTGMEPYDPDGYYACYPASAVSYFSSSSKSYYYGEYNNTNKPLMAAYLDGSTFRFYNLCGVLTFKVAGDYDEYVFSGNDNETVGYTNYQVKINSEDRNYARTVEGELKSIGGPVVAYGATLNQVCFPNGVTLNKGFTILFLKNGSIVDMVSTKESYTVEISRGKLLPLGDITGYIKEYTPPEEHIATHPAIDGNTVDLGSVKTANCYIVDGADNSNADKVYKFLAVKGNGSDPVGAIEEVELLWETYNTTDAVTPNSVIAEVDFEKKSGESDRWISFKMPSNVHPGNAVIAVKDGAHNILWSWHIWVPGAAVSSDDYTSFIGGEMMNMNLGAIEPVPASGPATIGSLGLLYQWGRKDPFVGAAEWKDYPAKAAVSGETWSKTLTTVSIEDAIKTPTMYYYPQGDDKDWNSTPEATLWDNSGKKTIYDPCPPNYKVPVNSGAVWTKTDEGWNFDTTNHVSEHTASGVRLPLAGYIEAWGGSLYGSGGGADHTYLWSATHHDTERGECMYIRTSKDPGSKYYKAYRGKANAGSVRCIKE